MAKRLILVGAGDLGKEVIGWILASASLDLNTNTTLCFIDDYVKSMTVAGIHIAYIGSIVDYSPAEGDQLLVAVANPTARSAIVPDLLSRGCELVSYIHPSVQISTDTKIGQGCILLPNSVVSFGAIIGDFSIVNCCSSIGHHANVGSFVTISSHVDIMGHCVIGDQVFMGSGSRVLPGKRLGRSSTIGPGATAVVPLAPARTLYAPLSKLL